MKVVRKITIECEDEDKLARQMIYSAPPGKYAFPGGALSIEVEVLEEPDSSKVHKAIQYHPVQWPVSRMVK